MIAYVGLGSNLGNRPAHLRAGIEGLRGAGLELVACSSVWESEPVDTLEPLWFLNMVVAARTDEHPLALLGLLLDIERRSGRVRAGRNAPRALDLDLLLQGRRRWRDERLVLPHPRMWERRFVLCPLAEIAPEFRDPITGRTVGEILDGLDDGFVVRRISADEAGAAIIPVAEPTGLEHPGR